MLYPRNMMHRTRQKTKKKLVWLCLTAKWNMGAVWHLRRSFKTFWGLRVREPLYWYQWNASAWSYLAVYVEDKASLFRNFKRNAMPFSNGKGANISNCQFEIEWYSNLLRFMFSLGLFLAFTYFAFIQNMCSPKYFVLYLLPDTCHCGISICQ